jgi:hypothetical protein
MDITWRETRFLRVPLTDEEVQARGEQLAKELQDLRALRDEHADRKRTMKETEAALEEAVHRLAGIVRERTEERSVPVEIRYNRSEGRVQGLRLDTAEVVEDRRATDDDHRRASVHAQTTLLPSEPSA